MNQAQEILRSLHPKLGQEIDVSDWLTIDQQRIDAFAEVTGDTQWIHTDPERAASKSPFGATVAHGYLTLSLLPYLTGGNSPEYMQQHFPGMRLRVNYGLNRLRFPAPVKCGSRIRVRTVLEEARELDKGLEIIYTLTVEIEEGEKPALVAEQVIRVYP